MTVRRSTSRGAATRTRIVDAAADLFHARGVEATGLGDVLAASGAGKSQLYHYFGDKAGLVDDVIDLQADRILAWHTELLAEVDTVEGLRHWADAVVDAVAERRGAYGCPLGSLAAELADRSDAHRDHVVRGFQHWEAVLTAAVARVTGDAAGAAASATVLLTALQGGLLLADATRDTRHLRAALDAAIAGIARTGAGSSRTEADSSRRGRRPAR